MPRFDTGSMVIQDTVKRFDLKEQWIYDTCRTGLVNLMDTVWKIDKNTQKYCLKFKSIGYVEILQQGSIYIPKL